MSALEEGTAFTPRYDGAGLIPAIVVDAASGETVMLAWMNAEALAATLATGEVHFWSRSRGRLWRKGETSGQVQRLVEMRTDCDQDALLVKVEVGGAGAVCHTGRATCFYRAVGDGGTLRMVDGERRIDPAAVYGTD